MASLTLRPEEEPLSALALLDSGGSMDEVDPEDSSVTGLTDGQKTGGGDVVWPVLRSASDVEGLNDVVAVEEAGSAM